MAAPTFDYATGQGMRFAFGMLGGFSLAVIRDGDLPIIIPPWTIAPIELPPYDTARPYFFLVRKNDYTDTVWRYLYFVRREFSDPHVSVTDPRPGPKPRLSTTSGSGPTETPPQDCPGKSAAAQFLTPATHYTRLFQLRTMQMNFFVPSTDKVWQHTCSVPVETMFDGGVRCEGGCPFERKRFPNYFLNGGFAGPSGSFLPIDSDFMCKVATDEASPSVFCVLPTFMDLGTFNSKACGVPDVSLNGLDYQAFMLCNTIDRCIVTYDANWVIGRNELKVALTDAVAKSLRDAAAVRPIKVLPKLRYLEPYFDPTHDVCDDNFDVYACA
jgi:hypothetical protein